MSSKENQEKDQEIAQLEQKLAETDEQVRGMKEKVEVDLSQRRKLQSDISVGLASLSPSFSRLCANFGKF